MSRNIEDLFGGVATSPKQKRQIYKASGGETVVTAETGFVSLDVHIDGTLQTPGEAYTLDGQKITFAEPLNKDNIVTLYLDVAFSPKEVDGEFVQTVVFTSAANQSSYKPEFSYSSVLVFYDNKPFAPDVDYTLENDGTINFKTPMAAGKQVYLVFGGYRGMAFQEDGSPTVRANKQAIARKFDIKDSEVTYDDSGIVLDGYKAIYEKASQRSYSLPSGIQAGSTITSLVNGVLTHSNGSVDLGALAVQREEWNKLTEDFTTGFTLNVANEVVLFEGELYRWGGAFPKEVDAESTPVDTGGINSDNWVGIGETFTSTQLSSVSGFTHIGSLPSVAVLKNIDLTDLVAGSKVYLDAYHSDSTHLGGGWLFWDPTGLRSSHDGFMVFSPSRAYPADWSNATQRAGWFSADTSSDNGVWRRANSPGELTVDYSGAKPYLDSQVDTESVNAYQDAVGDYGQIKFGLGNYRANFKPRAGVLGNAYGTVLKPADPTIPVINLEFHSTAVAAGWYWKAIDDLVIDCESAARTQGTCISYTTDTTLDSYQNRGRWVFNRIAMQNANIGIRKPYGNIGNVYNQLSTNNLNYGVWATAKTSTPVMHEGNDTFNKCHFTKCYLAAYRTDATVYGSSLDTHFNQCIFEYNAGFALLIRGSQSNQVNVGILKVNGGHFEGNGAVGTLVNIEGIDMQPTDIYSQHIRNIELEGVLISSITLVQSSVTAHRCQFSDVRGASYTYFSIDAYSQIDSYEDGSQYGTPLQGLVVHTIAAPNAFSRNGRVVEHRKTRAKMSVASPNGYGKTFDGSAAITSATGSAYVSTQTADSLLGDYSSRWTIPAATTVVLTDPVLMTMTNGRYYVWTVAARWISGDAALEVAQAGGATLSTLLTKGTDSFWRTFGGVGIYSTTGDNRVALRVSSGTVSTVIQTADFQIMTFATLAEALNWFNSGQCLGRNNA